MVAKYNVSINFWERATKTANARAHVVVNLVAFDVRVRVEHYYAICVVHNLVSN